VEHVVKEGKGRDGLCAVATTTFRPGADPTTANYNAGVVKIYNETSGLVRFKNKNSYFYFEKRSSICTTPLAL
jgi:hypothetical protein